MIPDKFVQRLFLLLSIVPIYFAFEVTQCGKLPGGARGAVSAVYDGGDYVYLLGGLTSAGKNHIQLNTVYQYNILTHESKQMAGFPLGVSYGAAVLHSDETIYYFGGGYIFADDSSVYDFPIYKLRPPAYIPEELNTTVPFGRIGGSAQSIGGDIYIFGGYQMNHVNQVLKFHPTSLMFEAVATLPISQSEVSSAAIGNRTYIFGNTSAITEFNSYTIKALTPTKLNHVHESSAAVKTTDDMIYIFGRNKDVNDRRQTQFYYGTNTVKEVCSNATLPGMISGSSVYVPKTDQIMIFGGEDTKGFVDSVLCINRTTIKVKSCNSDTGSSGVMKNVQSYSFIIVSIILILLK